MKVIYSSIQIHSLDVGHAIMELALVIKRKGELVFLHWVVRSDLVATLFYFH